MRGGCQCRSLGALDEMKENRKEDILEFESKQDLEPEGCGCNTEDDFTCAEHQAYHEEMEQWMNG